MMNLDELVQAGRLPWSPTARATDVDVWHEHEVPLVGMFYLDDQAVLFAIIGDLSDDLTVWAYRCLSADEAAATEDLSFESISDLRTHVEQFFVGNRAVLVLASDLIIEKWAPVDVEESLLKSAVLFLKDVLAASAPNDTMDAFRRAVAAVESVRSELVEA